MNLYSPSTLSQKQPYTSEGPYVTPPADCKKSLIVRQRGLLQNLIGSGLPGHGFGVAESKITPPEEGFRVSDPNPDPLESNSGVI